MPVKISASPSDRPYPLNTDEFARLNLVLAQTVRARVCRKRPVSTVCQINRR